MTEQDLWSQFGESNDSKRGGKYKTRFKFKEGEPSLFLIMPALFSCREAGEWIKFERAHWGFQYPGSNGGRGEYLLFRCVREMDWSVRPPRIKKDCPQCAKYDAKQAEFKEREQNLLSAFKAHGMDEMTAKARLRDDDVLKSLGEWLKKYRANGKWHLNVMNTSGEFGYISISNKSKIVLCKAIDEIKAKYKIDPRNPKNMVWWSIERTSIKVQEMTEIIRPVMDMQSIPDPNGGPMPLQIERLRVQALTPEQGSRCLRECADLNKLSVDLSLPQIKALADSDGSPDEVARIVPKTNAPKVQVVEDEYDMSVFDAPAAAPTTSVRAGYPPVVVQTPVVIPPPVQALAPAFVATSEATPPPAITTPIQPLPGSSEMFYSPPVAPQPQTSPVAQIMATAPSANLDISKMSNSDFLKQMKI